MERGNTFRSTVPKFPTTDPDHRILARQRSRFTHYYFYIRDETPGPMVLRVASLFPFRTTYYLNGHSFMENELNRKGVKFRKDDNAFLSVSDPEALHAAADRFTSDTIRKRLDYRTLIPGPKFSGHERSSMNLRRFYAVSQIGYCRNFIFKRNFPVHRIFGRGCEFGLWRLTANRISEIFGARVIKGSKANSIRRWNRSGTAITSSALTAGTLSSNSTRSSPPSCATKSAPINLSDFGLKKGPGHLAAVRSKFLAVTDRSQLSRRSGSTCMWIFLRFRNWRCLVTAECNFSEWIVFGSAVEESQAAKAGRLVSVIYLSLKAEQLLFDLPNNCTVFRHGKGAPAIVTSRPGNPVPRTKGQVEDAVLEELLGKKIISTSANKWVVTDEGNAYYGSFMKAPL